MSQFKEIITHEYQKLNTFEKRKELYNRFRLKFNDRLPIICELGKNCEQYYLDKYKYLVPYDLMVAQFMAILRKRINIMPEVGLFLTVGNNEILNCSERFNTIYNNYKHNDGFLYIIILAENTFG